MKEQEDIIEVTARLKLSITTLIRIDMLAKDWGLSRGATVEKLLEDLMTPEDHESSSKN